MDPQDDDLVITGMGIVCNLGHELSAIAAHIRGRGPGVFSTYTEAAGLDLGCTVCGIAPEPPDDATLGIERRESRFMGRASRLALWAARKAMDQSGAGVDDLAVVVGSGTGDVEAHIDLGAKILQTGSARRAPATLIPRIMSSTVSANLCNALRANGPSVSATAACAGGAWNLALAGMLVQSGHANAALAGGVEVRDLHFHAGFDRIQAYNRHENDDPRRASRPYAADRDGFVFGEGAGVVVIERRSSAAARGATVLGELLGWGMSSDGQGEMVAPCSEGAARSMLSALRHARLSPDQVDYVNTHATSTPSGDLSEVHAMRQVFGRHLPYSSIKGYTGHSVSGAGALEAIVTWHALREGWLPPCGNIEVLDPALVDYPPVLEATPTDARIALSNSFGFGGTNVTLALGGSRVSPRGAAG